MTDDEILARMAALGPWVHPMEFRGRVYRDPRPGPDRPFTHPNSLRLNPDFGEASRAVGGADADLIAGDLLVDVKTTKSAVVTGEALDQLFSYFLLARRAGLPPIRRIGVYFSRFAQLRTGRTSFWTAHTGLAKSSDGFLIKRK